MTLSYEQAVDDIIKAGKRLDSMGLAPATSGNYSMRIGENEMAITVSGAHKGQLTPDDVMRADLDGNALEDKKPSAETLLHCSTYKLYPDIFAVLHTHSVACSVVTRVMARDNFIILHGYEMLKAFPNVDTHQTSVRLPIFENTQDMVELSTRVEGVIKNSSKTAAYLIRAHGIYGWGHNMDAAMRVIEATEMLLTCELQMMQINNNNIKAK